MGEMRSFKPFPSTIPIVGQPFKLKGWFPTVLITCLCQPHGEPVMLVGTAPGQCPQCQRAYVVGQVNYDATTNHLQIGIGLVRPPEPAGVPS